MNNGNENETGNRSVIHVEVAVKPLCPIPLPELRDQWNHFLDNYNDLSDGDPLTLITSKTTAAVGCGGRGGADHYPSPIIDPSVLPEELAKSCIKASVTIDDDNYDDDDCDELITVLNSSTNTTFVVHTFILSEEDACTEELDPSGNDDEDFVSAADSLQVPNVRLDGLWENLIFGQQEQQQQQQQKQILLNYAQSALEFADCQVSSNIVQWNRIVLLHGLPGTGKTSLCRALAQKLSIRLSHRFPQSTLLEIRSHSLFSKWFSTSGKLVSSLFQMIKDMVSDDPKTLICVLMDEVESLASSRDNSSNGGDPSDAMRAVNSLLTSLDKLRSFPNVLIMATTNLHITGTIDSAFVDRCDLLLEIQMPPIKARYEILLSCIRELQRVGIISDNNNNGGDDKIIMLSYTKQRNLGQQFKNDPNTSLTYYLNKLLLECADRSEGLSGRSLRRLPLQAHAKYVTVKPTSTVNFLQALMVSIQDEQEARSKVTKMRN